MAQVWRAGYIITRSHAQRAGEADGERDGQDNGGGEAIEALEELLLQGNFRAAMLAAAKVSDREPAFYRVLGVITDDPAVAFKRVTPTVRNDAIWAAWGVVLRFASSKGQQQHAAVHALLRLYAMRCNKRQRDTRMNLFHYALHACMLPGKKIRVMTPDPALAKLLERGKTQIDGVFDDTLNASAGNAESARSRSGHRQRKPRPGAPQTQTRECGQTGSYLNRLTQYNDAARCEIADELRDVHLHRMTNHDVYIKNTLVSQRQ